MPVNPNASVCISAFNWVPPFAQGHVRDLRPRWAFEEAGISYAVRKLDAARPLSTRSGPLLKFTILCSRYDRAAMNTFHPSELYISRTDFSA
jgi:hypothetical protein